jgi:hypothetical protein
METYRLQAPESQSVRPLLAAAWEVIKDLPLRENYLARTVERCLAGYVRKIGLNPQHIDDVYQEVQKLNAQRGSPMYTFDDDEAGSGPGVI